MRAKQFVPIVEAQQELFEVKMSPNSLKKLAGGIDALVGIEFEMIVPDVGLIDDHNVEHEPDYGRDERVVDIDDIIRFFGEEDDRQGPINGEHQLERLRDELNEKFSEWQDVKIDEAWNSDDGKEFFFKWVKDNIDPDYIADYLDKEEDLFGNRDLNKSDYIKFAEDVWEENVDSSSYEKAYDDFREDKQGDGDFDEATFLSDIDIFNMSDVANIVSTDISWPFYDSDYGGDSDMDLALLASEFSDVIGREVHYSAGYQDGPRTSDAYTIEPDASLSGSGGDAGLEFISPPLSIDEALEDVKKVKEWADDKGAYTNRTTGLHLNVSVPGFNQEKLDFVKLTLLLGDKYLLDRFGRSANGYCKSAMDIIEEAPSVQDKELLFKKLKDNLEIIASKVIHSGRVNKYTSINPKDNRVEFRGPGGDWLGDNFDKIEETLYRCVVALDAAVDPEKYRKEYLKKLTKMFAPAKDSMEEVFVQYAAGAISREALKSRLKATQLQRQEDKLTKEGIIQIDSYYAQDGDYIIEYDNPTGDNRRMFLKRTEQVDTPNKAVEAAMKIEPNWFKPDDIENIIVTEYAGRKVYNVFDKEGNVVGTYNAVTPLQAIDITFGYDNRLPKQELTAKLESESQPEPLRMAPDEQMYLVTNTDTGHEVRLAAASGAQAISRATRNDSQNFPGGNSNSNISVTELRTPPEQPELVQFQDGTKRWYLNGKYHRTDGPAVEYTDGTKEWCLNGKTHRTDGPAIEHADGSNYWYLNDRLHRTDGPAIEYADGTREWHLNGEYHRTDGPAIEHISGTKEWYLNGKRHRTFGPAIEYADGTKKWYLNGERQSPPSLAQDQGTAGPTRGETAVMDSYLVSDPGDNAGGVRFRANSPEHAIERARAAFNLPADRELQARLENG